MNLFDHHCLRAGARKIAVSATACLMAFSSSIQIVSQVHAEDASYTYTINEKTANITGDCTYTVDADGTYYIGTDTADTHAYTKNTSIALNGDTSFTFVTKASSINASLSSNASDTVMPSSKKALLNSASKSALFVIQQPKTSSFKVTWDDQNNSQSQRPDASAYQKTLSMQYSIDSGSTWKALDDKAVSALGYTAVPAIASVSGTDTSTWTYTLTEGLNSLDENGNKVTYQLAQSSAPEGYTASYDADRQLVNTIKETASQISLLSLGQDDSDVTNNTEQLKLTINKLVVVNKLNESIAIDLTSGTGDLSKISYASIDHIIASLGFNILDDTASRSIKAGDVFTCTVPDGFVIADVADPVTITTADGTAIANYTVSKGVITVAFLQAVDISSGNTKIGGDIVCDFTLDGTKLNADEGKTIDWQLQKDGTTYHFNLPPKSSTMTGVSKTGKYNKEDNTIVWTITVGTDTASKGLPLAGITVNDTYDKTALSILSVTGANGEALTPVSTDTGFSCTFPADSSAAAPYQITVKTQVAPEELTKANSADQSIENEASLKPETVGDITVPADQKGSDTVTIPSFHIEKNGSQVDSSIMEWTLLINKDGAGCATNVAVYDQLDTRSAYQTDSLTINGTKVKVYTSEPTDEQKKETCGFLDAKNLLTIYFAGTVSSAQTIVFDTALTFNDAQKDEDVTFPNSAWISYDWPTGKGPLPSEYPKLSVEPSFNVADIDKEVSSVDKASGMINWSIASSVRTDNYSDWKITDVIETDQSLIDGSIIVKNKGEKINANDDFSYTYSESDHEMTFTFNSQNHTYSPNDITITYSTKAIDYVTGTENFTAHTYNDTADISVHSNLAEKTYFINKDSASVTFENDFLKKTGDYTVIDNADGTAQGYLHYQIAVNASHLAATNLNVSENLNTDLTMQAISKKDASKTTSITFNNSDSGFVVDRDKTKITKIDANNQSTDVTSSYSDNTSNFADSGILSLSNSAQTTDSYVVDYYLKLNGKTRDLLPVSYPDGYIIVQSNKAHAQADEYNSGNAIDVSYSTDSNNPSFKNQMIAKTGDTSNVTADNPDISYRAVINPNASTLSSVSVSDTLDDCLSFNQKSVKLYYAKHNADGSVSDTVGMALETGWSASFANHSMTISLPDGTRSYVLCYTARVVSKPTDVSKITNNIKFSEPEKFSSSDNCSISVNSSAWAWMSKSATLKLIKKDSLGSTPLKGAVYELYGDAECTDLIGMATTDANGSASFYGLKYSADGTSYWYKEKNAPDGYVLDDNAYEIKTTAAGVKNVNAADERKKDSTAVIITKVFSTLNSQSINHSQSSFELYLCPLGFADASRIKINVTGSEGTYAYSSSTEGTVTSLVNKQDDGTISITGLPWGQYAIKETAPQDGYAAYTGEKYFEIDFDSAKGLYVLNYQPTNTANDIGTDAKITNNPTNISISKTCDAGKDLRGAKLTVYQADTDGSKLSQPAHNPFSGSDYYTIISGDSAVTSASLDLSGIPAGTYYLSEDTAPTDTVLGKFRDVKFTVDIYGAVTINSGTASADNSKDTKTISVADDTLSVTVKKLDQFGNGVADATLQLQIRSGSEGSYTWTDVDGQSWTTASKDDAKAGHTFTGMTRGSVYRIIETTVPNGYRTANHLSEQSIEFTMNEYGNAENVQLNNGDNKKDSGKNFLNSVSGNSFTMRNELIVGQAELIKYDSTVPGKTLKGAGFDLYKQVSGETYTKINDSVIYSDAQGYVSTIGSTNITNTDTGMPLSNGLTIGTYYFKECDTPKDFVTSTQETIHFEVNEGNSYTWPDFQGVIVPAEGEKNILNTPLNAAVTLTKRDTDDTAKAVNGAVYELIDSSNKLIDTQTTSPSNTVFEKYDSNENLHVKNNNADGQLYFVNVPAGTYTVKEKTPAPGYTLDTNEYSVTVSQDAADKVYTIEAETNGGIVYDRQNSLTISKHDADGKSLAGAQFKLEGTFAAGTDPVTWTSDGTSKQLKGQLIAGNIYHLSETAAPEGYTKWTGGLYLKITNEGQLQKCDTENGTYTDVTDNAIVIADAPSSITLNKIDKDGNALAGSSFAIAGTFAGNTEDSEKVLVNGETSGSLSSQLIIGNTYVIKETSAPEGYAKIKDFSVKVNEDGTLTAAGTLPVGVTLNQNTVTVADHKTDVTVKKQDAAGNALIGSTIKITGVFSDSNDQSSVKTVLDGTQDTGALLGKLIEGNDYTLEETAAPIGYESIHSFMFHVNDDGSLAFKGDHDQNISLDNETLIIKDAETRISFIKYDEDGNELVGSTFALTGKMSDDPEHDAAIELLNGTASEETLSRKLIIGNTYTLQEKSAPKGYTLLKDPITFSVNADGTVELADGTSSAVSLTGEEKGIMIKDTMISVQLRKVSKDTKDAVQGADFKITGKFVNGKTELTGTPEELSELMKGNLYASDISADESTWSVYSAAETKRPDGYLIEENPVEFLVDDQSKIHVVADESKCSSIEDGVTLDFADDATKVSVLKTDTNGKALAGAQFKIEGTFADGSKVQNFASETEASTFKALFIAGNTYTISEVKAPDGYVKMQDTISFTVGEDGLLKLADGTSSAVTLSEDQKEIKIADDATKVSVLKTDVNGKALAGAQFKIEGMFADGSKVQNFTSETEASTFKALFIAGNTYTISEVKAPDGYVKMKDAVSFTVGEDGLLKLADGTSSAVTLSEDQKEIKIADDATKVSVLKTDTNGKALAGAQFNIEGMFADGSKVQNFASETEASTFKALFIAGNTYTISEVKAPDGYDAIRGSISFRIDETGKIILNSSTKLAEVSEDGTVLKIANTETIVPVDTGDKTNTILYFGIMIGAAAIAIALIIFRKKKEKH